MVSNKSKSDLESCSQWVSEKKLSVYVRKTKCILFGSQRNLNQVKKFKIEYNGFTIMGKQTVKYLGVILDQTLSGEQMTKSVLSKITKKLKFMYRYHHCLKTTARKNLCSALLQGHFDYCCASWFLNLSSRLKRKLQTSQNNIVRFIIGLPTNGGQSELDSIN